jgi:hypothetical protein
MESPRTISVSQVNAYLGCPLKYRFQYLDKIPRPWRVAAMAFGSSVHAAVEWFHRERLADRSTDLETVLKVFDADWYAQNVEPLVFSERESALSPRRAPLRLYVESTNGTKPVAVEQFFESTRRSRNRQCSTYGCAVSSIVEEGETLVDPEDRGQDPRAGGLSGACSCRVRPRLFLLPVPSRNPTRHVAQDREGGSSDMGPHAPSRTRLDGPPHSRGCGRHRDRALLPTRAGAAPSASTRPLPTVARDLASASEQLVRVSEGVGESTKYWDPRAVACYRPRTAVEAETSAARRTFSVVLLPFIHGALCVRAWGPLFFRPC